MVNTLLELAYRLTQAGESFVLATVVWCERPTSAKPGAQALIQSGGEMTGWIGGSCAQPVVLREALRLLREGGDPYLMRLGASDQYGARSDVRSFPMSCTSGGVLDIYMEPHVAPSQLLLIGDSPVLEALGRLAAVVDFGVRQLHSPDLSQVQLDERTLVVVASHGQYDEDVLEKALPSPACYVGLVGSRKRGEACRAYLRSAGLTEGQVARLKVPAGVDLGVASAPAEIAVSILAQLVQAKRRITANTTDDAGEQAPRTAQGDAIDPVCGMTVEIASARHHSVYEGQDYYFCCPACKRLFARNPREYLVQNADSQESSLSQG